MDKYINEVKERWGDTEAFAEFSEKTKGCSKEKFAEITDGLNGVFKEFAVCRKSGAKSGSDDAQKLVKRLKEYISENFYSCTDKILLYLGQMYVSDERFKSNIDKHGSGTAEFVFDAISSFCNK